MKYIIDRIEGEYAICEKIANKDIVNIHVSKLPSSVKIGDVISIDNDEIIVDKTSTEKRKEHIEELTRDIWQ
ncbi:MAG: DUF3006 domain-containing protein [Clostridiales bacterium]|nr:DUF3006 domain-containing protein [Clostridiales bacterium]